MAYTLRAAVDRARKSNRSSDIQMLWLVIDSAPDVARSNHVRERLGKRRCYWLAANDPMGGWL